MQAQARRVGNLRIWIAPTYQLSALLTRCSEIRGSYNS